MDYKGININDVNVLMRHISGLSKLKDPLKLIAADVNCDGLVDNRDYDVLYSLISGKVLYSSLPKHWRFIPKSFVFSNPLNPFVDAFESTMDFVHMGISKLNMDFIAIRVGELDGVTGGIDPPGYNVRNQKELSSVIENFELLNVFPNPVSDQAVHFQLNIYKSNTIMLNWYDAQGNILQQDSRSFDKGIQIWDQPVNQLPSAGIYFYRLTGGSSSHFGKLTLSK